MSSPDDRGTRGERWPDLATLAIVLAGAVSIPLFFWLDPVDLFRLPKAMLFRAEAILLVSVTLAACLLGTPVRRPHWRDPWFQLTLAAFAAIMLLTFTSTKPQLSIAALVTAAATLIVFLATIAAARNHGWMLLAAPIGAAVVNALLLIVEEMNLWMPFGEQPGVPHHLRCGALIGNPNEVGCYLGAAALACLAGISTRPGAQRWTVGSLSLCGVLVAGLVASQTLTAIVAFGAGAAAMLAMSSWKRAMRVATAGFVAAILIVIMAAPFRARAIDMIRWMGRRDYNAIFTERFTSFVAAWSMFEEHPLTGVGPGAFAWQYYDHKILAERRYPTLRHVFNRGVNFGEVHNDHLQVLAEGGIIGYGVFAALLSWLAVHSLTIPADATDSRQRFVRRLALALALYWVVLSIAQFPLETTVVRSLLVHLSALCVAWRAS